MTPPRTGPALRGLLLALALLEFWWTARAWTHPPVAVLIFHDIGARKSQADFWTIRPDVFRAILDRLEREGLRTIGDDELAGIFASRKSYPPSVMLTFDDGFASHRDIVAPELARRGMKAVFYLVTGWGAPDHLVPGEAAWLASSGFRIGSHSATHGSLLRRPSELPGEYHHRLVREVAIPRGQIRKAMGAPCLSFAYPRGEVSPEAVEMARVAGYRLAFTTELGHAAQWNDPYLLPRSLLFHDADPDAVAAFCTEPLRMLRWRIWVDMVAIALLLASFAPRRPVTRT